MLLVALCAPSAGCAQSAQSRHVDRLAILVEEHKEVTRQVLQAEAEKPRDEEKLRGLRVNLDALNKEIAFVRKQPVYEDSGLSGGGNVPAKQQARAEPKRQASSVPMTYDSWDIFQNFGKAENAKTE
jgi:hypothetical protein